MDEKKLQNSKSVIEFLKAHNFSNTHITQLIEKRPELLQSRVKSNLKPKFDFFTEYGVMLQMSEFTWKKKVEVLKSLGWTEEKILQVFKQDPFILGSSEEKIRGAVDFFVSTLRLKPQTVIANSWLLHYSIDKRLRPRYHVLRTLKSKNLIDGDRKIKWLLTSMSEKKFLEN